MIPHFQREEFTEPLYLEMLPLLVKHHEEIAQFKDIPLDVDLDAYLTAELSASLRVFTVRVDRLIGYAVFFVRFNPHYASSLQAVEDVLFLDRSFRKSTRIGVALIRFAEEQLRDEGVQLIYHHAKVAHPQLGTILERFGYDHVENIYVKRVNP